MRHFSSSTSPTTAVFAMLLQLHCMQACVANAAPTETAHVQLLLLPSDELWQDGNLQAISDAFGCVKNTEEHGIEDSSAYSTIPTAESHFHALYQAYHSVIPAHHYHGNTLKQHYTTDGWMVPVTVQFDEIMGRGIFADDFIEEGTAVWSPNNAAEFHSAADFRRFLEWIMLFPEDHQSNKNSASAKDLVCDALMWSYTAKKAKDSDEYIICVDLDTGSLLNLADQWDRNIQQDVRVDDAENRYYGCQEGTLYANRDIEQGEELRMYYGDCSEPEGWRALGLRWS